MESYDDGDSDMNLWPSQITMSYADPGDGFDEFPDSLRPSDLELICTETSALLEIVFENHPGSQQNAIVLWAPSPDGSSVTFRSGHDEIILIEEARRGLGFSVISASPDIPV